MFDDDLIEQFDRVVLSGDYCLRFHTLSEAEPNIPDYIQNNQDHLIRLVGRDVQNQYTQKDQIFQTYQLFSSIEPKIGLDLMFL